LIKHNEVITTSHLIDSIKFTLKPDLIIDSSTAQESALVTVDYKYVSYCCLSVFIIFFLFLFFSFLLLLFPSLFSRRSLVFNLLTSSIFGIKTRKVNIGLEINSFVVNHHSGMIAVGTQYGEILLLRNVSDYLRSWYLSSSTSSSSASSNVSIKKEKELDSMIIKSRLIWHSHAIKSLAFNVDGKILYSGGEESVLVVWNLNKSTKSFIPRIGSPISYILTFQTTMNSLGKILLSSSDNSLKLINTVNYEIDWFWQSLYIAQSSSSSSFGKISSSVNSDEKKIKIRDLLLSYYLYPYSSFDQQSEKHWKPSIEIDTSSSSSFSSSENSVTENNIVLAGNLGYLQFFDINKAIVTKKLNIINFLRVSRKDSAKHLFIPTIIHYKFTKEGIILVTIDCKKGEDVNKEYSLKFWLLSSSSSVSASAMKKEEGGYELVAQMNNPHNELPITSLSVNSIGKYENQSLIGFAATASSDGTVKVWK
jgi:hypothetical protein